MKRSYLRITALLFSFSIIMGCATVFAPVKHKVSTSSEPDEATVYINGENMGTTPVELKLRPNTAYNVEFRKEGYGTVTRMLNTQIEPAWVVIDVICGGWPILIDLLTGKWNKFDQNSLDVVLEAQNPPAYTHTPNQPQYRGSGDPLKGLNVSKDVPMKVGKYYALLVGIDNYSGDWASLKNAVNDAKAIETLLRSNYRFDNFKTLYNSEATRPAIMNQMEWLAENVKEDDNVFIYYSGHGEFKENMNKGYWVPIDAKTKSVSGYISNNDIQAFLIGIKSKHTLLVSDACFSGDIFRGSTISVPFEDSEKYYRKVHNLVSRSAITSGGIEPVMDGGRDGHSVFAYYFLKALKNNTSMYMDASEVYGALKIPVTNNSDQSPNFSPIKNTGDEGGQFVFIKK